MKPDALQAEMHRSGRAGWLRAAVLGSDDAIVSTASIMIGVAASSVVPVEKAFEPTSVGQMAAALSPLSWNVLRFQA